MVQAAYYGGGARKRQGTTNSMRSSSSAVRQLDKMSNTNMFAGYSQTPQKAEPSQTLLRESLWNGTLKALQLQQSAIKSDAQAQSSPGPYEKSNLSKMTKRPISFQQAERSNRVAAAHRGLPRTQDYKDALRKRYVDQLRKYVGVPYAKRLLKPDDPLYDAPLFLDCCALVARGIRDLHYDFGFELGRGNQAYQLDTLPIKLKQREMQPGDLIFYSAEYYKPKNI